MLPEPVEFPAVDIDTGADLSVLTDADLAAIAELEADIDSLLWLVHDIAEQQQLLQTDTTGGPAKAAEKGAEKAAKAADKAEKKIDKKETDATKAAIAEKLPEEKKTVESLWMRIANFLKEKFP